MLLCACNRLPYQTVPVGRAPQVTILDEALAKYSNAIVRAQQELPTDKWEEKPFHHNASCDQRVSTATKPMFEELKLRLKGMSVTNLVKSLKLIPYPYGNLTNQLNEAAQYVYSGGNWFIINEIKARPSEELRGLEKLGSDKLMLVEEPQGFGLPLTCELEDILHDRGLTNGWSR
jgi:hypothetical protein